MIKKNPRFEERLGRKVMLHLRDFADREVCKMIDIFGQIFNSKKNSEK